MMGGMSENETGIIAYDLAPPGRWPMPRLRPLLDRGERSPMPRYVPGPLAEGTVRVVLSSAGADGEPPDFEPYETYWTTPEPYRVFDVPREQYERWRAAKEAFRAMEEEIEALISDRARDPLPRPSPGLPC
jgi:hypothetical protein